MTVGLSGGRSVRMPYDNSAVWQFMNELISSKQTAPISNSDFLKRMISVLNPKGEVSKADQAELTRLIREKLELSRLPWDKASTAITESGSVK